MASSDPDFAALSERLVRAWAASWTAHDSSQLTALFTRDGVWTDHSFRVIRKGTTALGKHYDIWLAANPDFYVAEVKNIWPTQQGCVIKYIGKGTMTGDLAGIWKPTGRSFEFTAYCEIFVRKQEGLIERLEEAYCNDYWESNFNTYNFQEEF